MKDAARLFRSLGAIKLPLRMGTPPPHRQPRTPCVTWTAWAGPVFCLIALTGTACEKTGFPVAPADDPTRALVSAVRTITDVRPTRIHYEDFAPDLGQRVDAAIEAQEWSEWESTEHWGDENVRRAVERGEELPSLVAYYLTLRVVEQTQNKYLVAFEALQRMSDDSGEGKEGTITVTLAQGGWESSVVVEGYSTITWDGEVR